MPFVFTGGGHSNEMAWSAEKQLEAGGDCADLGGITELAREPGDLARIGRGRRTDEPR